MKNNQPIYKRKAGTISMAIFEREFENKKGDKITKWGVVLQRGYRKKDSAKWINETMNFNNITELKRAIFLLGDAEEKILFKDIEIVALPKEVQSKPKEIRVK